MNILFVIHTPKDPLTAVCANVQFQAKCLESYGHQTDLLAPADFSSFQGASARKIVLLYPFVVAMWLIRHGKEFDAVIFHSYAGWAFCFLRRFLPFAKHIRVVTSFHGLEPLAYSKWRTQAALIGQSLSWRYHFIFGKLLPLLIRQSCRRSDLVTCLNSDEATYLAQQKWAVPEKIVRFDNYVDETFFLERRPRQPASRLLFVGQWGEMKGIRYLAEAFTALARAMPTLNLWCVGTGANEETVLANFPDDVRAQVCVRSRASREEIRQAFQEADIFIFPTLSEGSSHALLEAMAAALPIVTTSVGAAPDMLVPDKDVLFVPERSSTALVSAVQRLLTDSALRFRLSFEAQMRARQYESTQVGRQYLKLVESTEATSNISGERSILNRSV
jgi:glycosyltransferase involved in cell wall biosynthesis